MPGICLKFTLVFHRCTWDIPELNLRYTLVIPDSYLRFELDLSKTCQRLTRFSWDIPEMFWLKRLLLEKNSNSYYNKLWNLVKQSNSTLNLKMVNEKLYFIQIVQTDSDDCDISSMQPGLKSVPDMNHSD